VPAFDEALRSARCFGTQAWSPAAGIELERKKLKQEKAWFSID
jgi:hypothetical protein